MWYITQNSPSNDAGVLLNIYYTLYCPALTHRTPPTYPCFCSRLIIVQNKTTCMIDAFHGNLGSHKSYSFNSFRLSRLGKTVFIHSSIDFFFQLRKVLKFVQNIHNTRRNNINLLCPRLSTTVFNNSVLCGGRKSWNSLTPTIKIKIRMNNYVFEF